MNTKSSRMSRLAVTTQLAAQATVDRFAQADAVLLKASQPASAPNLAPVQDAASSTPSISATTYLVGQSYDVPVNLIREWKYNARVFYSPGEIDMMSTSLQQNEQEVDAIGFFDNGHVYLIEGQMRWRGCLSGGLPTLRVKFKEKPASAKESYLRSRRINLERSSQTAIDDAVRWQEMLDEGVFDSQNDLAESVGIGESNVSRTLAINRIPEGLRHKLLEHKTLRTLRGAHAISTIFDPKKHDLDDDARMHLADDVLDYVFKHDCSVAVLEKLIESKLVGKKTRQRADIVPIRFAGVRGSMKVNLDAGKLELSISDLPPEELQKLKSKIEAVLGE